MELNQDTTIMSSLLYHWAIILATIYSIYAANWVEQLLIRHELIVLPITLNHVNLNITLNGFEPILQQWRCYVLPLDNRVACEPIVFNSCSLDIYLNKTIRQ